MQGILLAHPHGGTLAQFELLLNGTVFRMVKCADQVFGQWDTTINTIRSLTKGDVITFQARVDDNGTSTLLRFLGLSSGSSRGEIQILRVG